MLSTDRKLMVLFLFILFFIWDAQKLPPWVNWASALTFRNGLILEAAFWNSKIICWIDVCFDRFSSCSPQPDLDVLNIKTGEYDNGEDNN